MNDGVPFHVLLARVTTLDESSSYTCYFVKKFMLLLSCDNLFLKKEIKSTINRNLI